MGFLGSIGKVMEYSEISDLFQVVYSSATAVHMLSEKVNVLSSFKQWNKLGGWQTSFEIINGEVGKNLQS